MNPAFWRGRRVLVTGHTGFKGSWLCLWLQRLGATLTGFALPSPARLGLFEVARVDEGMTSVEGDVRDLERVSRVVTDSRPEVVLHLAAQSLVRYSYTEPVETFTTNVMGTVNVLETVRRAGDVRVVINVTSDKCYQDQKWIWGYRESDRLGGHDPYSSSKGCAELVTDAYRQSYFTGAGETTVATVRAGNVIGGGDWATDRLVPDVVRAFLAGEPATIRNPRAIRPWQYVLEPLDGYLTLAERMWAGGEAFGGAWNFGPGPEEERPVEWVVGRLAVLWGDGAGWRPDPSPQPRESQYLRLDSSKARNRLGWRPRLALDTALEWTVEWYRACRNGEDLRKLTERQIAAFEEMTRR